MFDGTKPLKGPGLSVKQEYLDAIRKAGFRDIAVVEEKPFDSPAMKGPLVGKIISLQVTAYK